MIVWSQAMSTGVPELDAQHKELLARFNELETALSTGKEQAKARQIVDFLQFYSQWHFGREENCMEQYRCPVAAFNKTAHQNFLQRFGQLRDSFQKADADPKLVMSTFVELRDWIVNHFMKVDHQLDACVGH